MYAGERPCNARGCRDWATWVVLYDRPFIQVRPYELADYLCERHAKRRRDRRHQVVLERKPLPEPPHQEDVSLPESAAAWELRGALAGRWQVGLSLRGGRRVRGYVERVAASDAFALLWVGTGELHVPLILIRAVHRPHFHEPDWGPPVDPPPARELIALPMAGQLSLWSYEPGRA